MLGLLCLFDDLIYGFVVLCDILMFVMGVVSDIFFLVW